MEKKILEKLYQNANRIKVLQLETHSLFCFLVLYVVMLYQRKQKITMKFIIKLLVKNKSFIFFFLSISNIDR